ncbi:MAG: hypothetical protein ACP5VE_11760 [Chthonomonadales bacterium]
MELRRPEDIHNLYYAACAASWSDIPKWWTGSWIYPRVPYYRPITSMLFFMECRAFGTNFTAWDRVSLALHVINAFLVYILTVSLLNRHGLRRCLFGLVAVVFFATPANTMYFAVSRSLTWWPAQNDVLSLTFALLCLILLDAALLNRKPILVAASVLALAASVGSKEMGYITIPMAMAVLLYRRTYSVLGITAFAAAGAVLWIVRSVCVPHAWGPVMGRMVILRKWIHEWAGPVGALLFAGIWWPVAAAAAILILTGVGKLRKWPFWVIALADLTAACLCAQYVGSEGTWALIFLPDSFASLAAVILYLWAPLVFWRHRREEPGLLAASLMLMSFLPILQYGGRHYFYWPGAFLAVADAAFAACLWRDTLPFFQRTIRRVLAGDTCGA